LRALELPYVSLVVLAALIAPAAGGTEPVPDSSSAEAGLRTAGRAPGIEIEIVESVPVETRLDQPDIRNAADVWVEMIEGARETLDLAEFYLSNNEGENLLEPVIQAILTAAERGVRVRVLTDQSFYPTYPKTIDRLKSADGIEVRLYDIKPLTGGVLHAKYFIVDNQELFLGSQNFDWRALEHIHEIGLRVASQTLARTLGRIFDADWRLAGEEEGPASALDEGGEGPADSVDAAPNLPTWEETPGGEITRAYLVASPPELNPTGIPASEPELIRLVDSAKEDILIQLLSYSPTDAQRRFYPEIDNALRSAAARGVTVRMILSDWNKRHPGIDYLKSLSLVPNVRIRLSTIPPWSGGFIPFARVEHCKYMVIDGRTLWVGTSNWSKDYFHSSRNVEMVVVSDSLAERMRRVFEDGWNGPYTYPLRVDVDYPAPRTRE